MFPPIQAESAEDNRCAVNEGNRLFCRESERGEFSERLRVCVCGGGRGRERGGYVWGRSTGR